MSMPADTPAAVITLPRSTTRSSTGTAPSSRSSSRASQCVVASTPSSTPAAASSSEPVHTDVVQVVVSWAVRIQSTRPLVLEQLAVAEAARHDDHLGLRQVGERGLGHDA